MSYEYSEDALVETATQQVLEELDWKVLYAWKNETFGAGGLLGRENKSEVILRRYLLAALKKYNEGLPKIKTAITRNLHIEQLKQAYDSPGVFTTSDIVQFYKKFEPEILKPTVNWRVYELVNRNLLERIGKGKFRLGSGNTFIPNLNTKHFKVNATIKTKFPFTNYCIWDSSFIKEFSQHITKTNFMLVDYWELSFSSARRSVYLCVISNLVNRHLNKNELWAIIDSQQFVEQKSIHQIHLRLFVRL